MNRERLAADYPLLGTDQLSELVPGKGTPIVINKLAPRDELISRGKDPLFFTHRESAVGSKEAADALLPTVYALYVAPQVTLK